MKLYRIVIILVTLVLFSVGIAAASDLSLPSVSYDVKVDVSLANDEDISVMHMHLDVLPDSIELLVPDFTVDVNTANNQFILFSYAKQLDIPSGNILRLHYDSVTRNTPFTLTTLGATNINADALITVPPVSGEIKIYFTTVDVDNTEKNIIALGTDGIDENNDGIINVIDLQKVINGQE